MIRFPVTSVSLLLAAALIAAPAPAQAEDEQPVGVVEQPDNVTGATTDEGASERAGAGFDTPWTPESYSDGQADNLEPKPFEATPNE